jgi:succinate dehydrogenase hydrophobic anchor subunit
MKDNKFARITILLLVIFVISVLFTILDDGSYTSAFEAGKAVGQTMRNFLKTLFTFALIVLIYRRSRKVINEIGD